jgi:GR25 family glycosyltransferase involved in LPS biosynthesis
MNNYVDNVYLINMDKDINRLKKVKKECDKVDIKFERFPRVKVSDLSQNILDKYIPKETKKYGTISLQANSRDDMIERGLSHLFVWQDAIQKQYKNILVLEDDVFFTDDFNEYFKNVMEELPEDYDILYLGYNDIIYEAPEDCSFNYIYKPILPYGLHAYIVSNKGLKKLVNLITIINAHIDSIIANNNNAKLDIYASKQKITKELCNNNNDNNNDNNNNNCKSFSQIINYCLDRVYNYNNVHQSHTSNFKIYKYKHYIITNITYIIFNLGIMANIHNSILLLLLFYFMYDYDKFHLIIFLLGYFIGNILKYTMNYHKQNQYVTLFSFILLVLFLNIIDFPFIVIKTLI